MGTVNVGDCNNEQEQTKANEALTNFQDQRHPGFKLVGDNVDIGQKARQQSKPHKNPDHHFSNLLQLRTGRQGTSFCLMIMDHPNPWTQPLGTTPFAQGVKQ